NPWFPTSPGALSVPWASAPWQPAHSCAYILVLSLTSEGVDGVFCATTDTALKTTKSIRDLATRHADERWKKHDSCALVGVFINRPYPPHPLLRKAISQRNHVASDYVSAARPGPFRFVVRIIPSLTRKTPGNFSCQALFAIGTYCRAFASTAVTPGTRAASPTECTRDAPGQVRS